MPPIESPLLSLAIEIRLKIWKFAIVNEQQDELYVCRHSNRSGRRTREFDLPVNPLVRLYLVHRSFKPDIDLLYPPVNVGDYAEKPEEIDRQLRLFTPKLVLCQAACIILFLSRLHYSFRFAIRTMKILNRHRRMEVLYVERFRRQHPRQNIWIDSPFWVLRDSARLVLQEADQWALSLKTLPGDFDSTHDLAFELIADTAHQNRYDALRWEKYDLLWNDVCASESDFLQNHRLDFYTETFVARCWVNSMARVIRRGWIVMLGWKRRATSWTKLVIRYLWATRMGKQRRSWD